MTRRRWMLLSAAVLVVPVVIAVVLVVRRPAEPVEASPSTSQTGEPSAAVHAHLGDSYAAGTGLKPLVPDSSLLCQRGTANFGELLARRRGWALTDVSCAGATTANLQEGQYEGVGPQLDALSPKTETVTLTLGGNDAKLFSTVVGECTRLGRTDPSGAPCRGSLGDTLTAAISTQVRPALTSGFREIAAHARRARVFVVGYPWLLSASGCFDVIPIAAGDVSYVRGVQRQLNDAVREAAKDAGVVYVDMSRRSAGHDACAGPARWITPVGNGVGSMHPNAAGQAAMADAVAAAMAGR
ncbi:SGNH/GDSL hydrolase family protein [Gordonia sp. (in: high G+C Gram-positive bacteria)]|uniref:SGNH/GDSL hydrolase family protein n=1 Tax=Gordonia sp. (in: high G+C Gram-positive bacteria) TaxID=84139 RepID=UPI002620FCFE|nr:SGNH/GDSL hydrolase family protein [Gordonia sp. (in: high G+C Gram-positive bacteria)]